MTRLCISIFGCLVTLSFPCVSGAFSIGQFSDYLIVIRDVKDSAGNSLIQFSGDYHPPSASAHQNVSISPLPTCVQKFLLSKISASGSNNSIHSYGCQTQDQ